MHVINMKVRKCGFDRTRPSALRPQYSSPILQYDVLLFYS